MTTPWNGEIYRTSTRSINIALCGNKKLGFIDETIKKPSTQFKEYHDWDIVDLMVTM